MKNMCVLLVECCKLAWNVWVGRAELGVLLIWRQQSSLLWASRSVTSFPLVVCLYGFSSSPSTPLALYQRWGFRPFCSAEVYLPKMRGQCGTWRRSCGCRIGESNLF